ncbi:beta-mannosidase isoform X2 [Syngnathoides biaculeatus]|uniref:beta-mannosidase isoform X2 n=1 Tax=Syngnathoides biaculeatus TaxID=300417 RepID=UPI002ADE0F71|nr:beta-mannosidase isoform X2 [Syngnathoides biaculeatus]
MSLRVFLSALLLFGVLGVWRHDGVSGLVQSLDGEWNLWNANKSLSLPARVPGCVHTALEERGVIQDPYFRFNDLLYEWISLDNWTYATTFAVSKELRSKRAVLLVLDGVDTVASVWLNGALLGRTDNMFHRYVFPVRQLLKAEDNALTVRFVSAVAYAAQRRNAHAAYPVPPECPPDVQNGQCHVNFIRKAQSSFSWDWGPSFPGAGLWKGVRLEAFDLLRLVQFAALPRYDAGGSSWSLQADALVDALCPASTQTTLDVPELLSRATFPTNFLQGTAKYTFALNINAQREAVVAQRARRTNVLPPPRHGALAGRRRATPPGVQGVFPQRGAGPGARRRVARSEFLLPHQREAGFPERLKLDPGALLPGPSHASLRDLLQSAADANMNVLRVWGGGVYERDAFYDTCDEMGLMVWQDFMFACATYPTEDDFVRTVREEVLQQVWRLKSHPSIIVWSANNENEAALAADWFRIPAWRRPVYLKDYVSLYVDNVMALVKQEDPSRPFLVSSPTNGAESEREGYVAADPYDPRFGDTHFYSYVHDCWDWRAFPRARFASEYGFQSWPSLSTLRPVSVPADWNLSSRFASHRQHHPHGNWQMLQQAAVHFRLPAAAADFAGTVYLTQVMQAQCVKAQTEFYRRSRSELVGGLGNTMGALYWQLNDIWQAPSWSSLEFGGKWKMLHYLAADFFADVLPVAFEDDDDDALFIYAVSDLSQDLKLRVVVSVHAWSELEPVCTLTSEPAVVPGGSAVPVFKGHVAALLAGCGGCSRLTCLLAFWLEDGDGARRGPANHHFLCSPKDAVGLRAANITAKVREDETGLAVDLQTSAVALFVWLDAGALPGRFGANGFPMLSRNRTVQFHAAGNTSAAELSRALAVTSLSDLYAP